NAHSRLSFSKTNRTVYVTSVINTDFAQRFNIGNSPGGIWPHGLTAGAASQRNFRRTEKKTFSVKHSLRRPKQDKSFQKVREDIDLRYTSEVSSNEPTLYLVVVVTSLPTRSKLHLTFQPLYVLFEVRDDDAGYLAVLQIEIIIEGRKTEGKSKG
ncbi:hypothetical protein ALC53_07830, partial [Atta colombica]